MTAEAAKKVLLISLTLVLSACQVHLINNAAHPSVAPPTAYTLRGGTAQADGHKAWWLVFARPELNAIIEQAFDANQDVGQAVARMQAAQAVSRQTRSGLFPHVDVLGNTADAWQGSDEQRWESQSGAALRWELDVFDRIASRAQADLFEAQAAQDRVAAVRLALSAEVARAYFGAVAARQRLNLLEQQVRIDNELLDLLQLRFESGVGTTVEVLQQESRVADSETLIPQAQLELRVFENRLDVLAGAMPDGADRVPAQENFEFTKNLPPVGVPADLLLNRPDLRAAQRALVAADANIAAAIADRLPRITLNGSYHYVDTLSYGGPLAAITGEFVQPLLDWGRRKYEVKRTRAIYTERLAAFTQLYLEAVEAVENALYQEDRQREFINRLTRRIEILRKTVNESEARYTQGIDNYLPVLNALQELREIERDLIDEQRTLVNARIGLHRALGGALSNEPMDNS